MNRFVVIPLCLVVLYTGSVSTQQASYGTPPLCLVSRLETVPCVYRNPQNTPRANVNEHGIYTTRIKDGSAGTPVCRIRRRGYKIRKIDNVGNDTNVKFIYSPGMRLEPKQRYGNQIIVFYNISCPVGHFAFFNLTRIDMEGPECFEPASNTSRCIDYVRVIRPGFGTTESCGNTPKSENMNQLEQREFEVILRTSDKKRFPGFEASVVCYRTQDANMDGCTRPDNSTDSMTTNGMQNGGRKKRDLDDFNNKWKRHLSSIKRMRRQSPTVSIISLRSEEINVTHGVDVLYEKNEIRFLNRDENDDRDVRESIKDIIVMHTFDTNGDIDEFKGAATNRQGDTIRLPGPGPMKILGKYAYFTLFVIDPRGILPNPVEMVAINNLTQAQFDLVVQDESERLNETFLEPPTIDRLVFGIRERRRRQSTPEDQKLSDEVLIESIRNENACNPILRAVARASIAASDKTRVETLRESLLPTGQLCPILPSIPNGIITYAPDETPDFDIGTIATYQCNLGFSLVGDMTRECGQDGVFNGMAPVCQLLVQCPELPPISNGNITYAPDDIADFDIGTMATYQCNPGFLLVGTITRECGQDGMFDGEAPVCQLLVQCPELPPISNGTITYGPDDIADFDIGTVATYLCSPGFFLVGNMIRVCEEDEDSRGVFSGVPPVCQELPVQCPELPPILNGFITYIPDNTPDFDIGTVATYQCNPDFFLVGDIITRVCGQDGVFNGEAPTCEPPS